MLQDLDFKRGSLEDRNFSSPESWELAYIPSTNGVGGDPALQRLPGHESDGWNSKLRWGFNLTRVGRGGALALASEVTAWVAAA